MKVIEFLGMPRAGKTTALELMETYFKRENVKVRTVHEGARISPLDKSDRYNYNAWSFHNTLNKVLEARLGNYDFILVDRGVVDHISFLKAVKPFCDGKDLEVTIGYYSQFLEIQDMELYFSVSPEEAIKREAKHKPFLGSVFNKNFLERLYNCYGETVNDMEISGRDIRRFNGNLHVKKNIKAVLKLCERLMIEDYSSK